MKSTILFAAFLSAVGAQAEGIVEKSDTLNEVVVTGTNNATNRNLIPFSVTTVSQEEIEATGRTQLLSALTGRIPSFFVTQRNIFGFGVSTGGSGGIKIRGVGNAPTSQVLMMVDGKPQFSGVFSHPVADNYESEFVDHVEVLRGPASVLYGSNAMGGAINVITKRAKENGVHTTLASQYGRYSTWQSALTNTCRFGNFSSLVSLGYDRTSGTQQHFDFKQGSGYVKLGYDFSDHWDMYADYSLMKFKGNDPIYAKLQNPESTDIYHQDVLRGEASAVLNDRYSKTNGAMRVYFSHGTHKVEDPNAFKSLDNRIGVLAYQNYQPWTYTNFTLGFDFDHYTGQIPLSGGKAYTEGSLTTIARKSITEYAPYVTASQGILHNLLIFNAGMRVSLSDCFGTHIIPQGGISFNPGDEWTVKVSVAKGYRNPSFKELYLYKMANPDLDPESMMNYEVSVGKSFSRLLTLELTGYLAKGSNLIQQDFIEELKQFLNRNTGAFTNKGIEFTASSHPIDCLMLRASYSFLHTDVANLTGAPKHQYYIAADWRATEKIFLNADVTGVSRLYVAEGVNEQSYALLDLKVTYRPYECIDLFVQGNNLTAARYYINKGYRMPGLSVTGGFKYRF